MNPFEFLNSINETKKNLFRNGENDPGEMAKQYSPYTTLRSLSYHADVVMFINELNQRGLVDFGVTPIMHYEFLLNVIPKRRRIAKWVKPEKDEDIELLANLLKVNIARAEEMYDMMDDQEKEQLKKLHFKGGRI